MSPLSRMLAVAAVLIAATPGSSAAAAAKPPPPRVPTAQAAILVDGVDGTVMFAKRPDAERAIASTTKLMTAMVTLARTDPGDVFAMPPYPVGAGESKLGLRTGERMTVRDLMRAMMLPSANDAAYDLAVNIGGSERGFVRMMNRHARALLSER